MAEPTNPSIAAAQTRIHDPTRGGGWGASANCDGADVVDNYVGNYANVPVEFLAQDYPFMVVEEYAMRRGSSGAGKRRGGLGTRRVYRILDDEVTFNSYSDRFRIAPWGLFGGQPGAPTRYTVKRGGEAISLPSKVNFTPMKGHRLIIEIAAGGGFGDPRKRDRAQVEHDLREGLITVDEAREAYGLEV